MSDRDEDSPGPLRSPVSFEEPVDIYQSYEDIPLQRSKASVKSSLYANGDIGIKYGAILRRAKMEIDGKGSSPNSDSDSVEYMFNAPIRQEDFFLEQYYFPPEDSIKRLLNGRILLGHEGMQHHFVNFIKHVSSLFIGFDGNISAGKSSIISLIHDDVAKWLGPRSSIPCLERAHENVLSFFLKAKDKFASLMQQHMLQDAFHRQIMCHTKANDFKRGVLCMQDRTCMGNFSIGEANHKYNRFTMDDWRFYCAGGDNNKKGLLFGVDILFFVDAPYYLCMERLGMRGSPGEEENYKNEEAYFDSIEEKHVFHLLTNLLAIERVYVPGIRERVKVSTDPTFKTLQREHAINNTRESLRKIEEYKNRRYQEILQSYDTPPVIVFQELGCNTEGLLEKFYKTMNRFLVEGKKARVTCDYRFKGSTGVTHFSLAEIATLLNGLQNNDLELKVKEIIQEHSESSCYEIRFGDAVNTSLEEKLNLLCQYPLRRFVVALLAEWKTICIAHAPVTED